MVTIYRQRKIYLLACVCILLLDIAIFWPFVLDDAWISFRYAQAWNNGFGLVFNPGEVVEGYTNFLWTIVIGLLMRLGLDPLVATKLFGVLLTLLTLLVTDELGVHLSFRGSVTISSVARSSVEYQCLFCGLRSSRNGNAIIHIAPSIGGLPNCAERG